MTDAGWTREKPTEAGWYWHRVDKNWRTYVVHVYQLQGALFVEFPDKAKPLIMVAGEWLGPISPGDYAAGRVEGLREAEWPNVIAPPKFDNPDPGWEDPQMPDLTRIWRLAHEVGYAVGLHGSLKRDMDLIAAPWTEQAVGNAALVDHLCTGLPAVRIGGPEHKPHGRVAVTLQIEGYFKPIDLSIVPRMESQIEQVQKGQTP